MKRYQVTGTLSIRTQLPALEGLSLVTLENNTDDHIIAADLLGVQPGDQVIVSTTGAQAVLGTNLPVDALVLCTVSANVN